MLKFEIGDLSEVAMAGLERQQEKVDAEASHEARYRKATSLFSGKRPARSFSEVRRTLADASPNGDACYYCERDRYRDIEHVRPKRHYPEQAFSWLNYVYACVVCNQDHKRDTYAVFTGGTRYVEFDRSLPFDDPVPAGDPVLIDPRSEDPLDYLRLDFETGTLVPVGKNARDRVRGKYTRDLFDLDAADLSRIRRNFVEFYLHRCNSYVQAKHDGDLHRAALILADILDLEHPTVIVELRRQSVENPDLATLFAQLPEEIGAWPSQ